MKYFLLNILVLFYCSFLEVIAQNQVPVFRKTGNGKYAMFNAKGEQLTDAVYDGGYGFEDICRAEKNWKYGFLDYNGNEVIPFIYDMANAPSEGLIGVRCDHKWGFISEDGTMIIPCEFSTASNFSEGLSVVSIREDNEYKYGFIDKQGKYIIQPKYEEAYKFREGFAAVKNDGKWAFIDHEMSPITPFKYSKVYNFENGIARVVIISFEDLSEGSDFVYAKAGYINTKGEEIIPFIYGSARAWRKHKVIEVSKGSTSGLYDFKGKVVIPVGKYYSINRIDDENNLIEVTLETDQAYLDGFVNMRGEEIIPPLYRFRSDFIDGLIYGARMASKQEIEELNKNKPTFGYQRQGVLDSLGNIIIPFEYENVSILKNGYFRVEDYNNQGQTIYAYFNSKGKQILPFNYFDASDFNPGGYALVNEKQSRQYMFIDTLGNVISIPEYDKIDIYFEGDLIAAKKKKKWGYINVFNETVIDFEYDDVVRFHNKLARVSKKGKYGYINTKGEIIIPIKFDEAPYYFNGDIEEFQLRDEKYYFNRLGEEFENTL